MAVSPDVNLYIKDSLINGRVCRFNKFNINIFVSKISANIPENEKNDYYFLISKAVNIWNELGLFRFEIINTPQNADITIIWTKVGRVFEGMCKYKSIIASEFRSVSVEIGLPNPNSPKIVNNSTILHSILHELGHSVGLGHGVDENDLMFVPHTKTLDKPSENDVFVLKTLYSFPLGSIL